MKKLLALTTALAVIACCFSACGSKLEGAEVYSDENGSDYAVVTDENGGALRNENGDLIVAVTDENGGNVTDKNGETITTEIMIDHALVVGNSIELEDFYMVIPKGWENNVSFNGAQIKNSTTGATISCTKIESGDSYDKTISNCEAIIGAFKTSFPDGVINNDPITINGEKAWFKGIYVEVSNDGGPIYVGHAVYQCSRGVFRINITSKQDLITNPDETFEIISSIQFKK